MSVHALDPPGEGEAAVAGVGERDTGGGDLGGRLGQH